jgi:hypothetical protein
MNDPSNWLNRPRAVEMTDELSRSAFMETATLLVEECGMAVDFIGRRGFDRKGTFTLEASGKYLSYRLKLDGSYLFLTGCLLDEASWRELLVIGDTSQGRAMMRGVIIALENSKVRDLSKENLDTILDPFAWSRSSM